MQENFLRVIQTTETLIRTKRTFLQERPRGSYTNLPYFSPGIISDLQILHRVENQSAKSRSIRTFHHLFPRIRSTRARRSSSLALGEMSDAISALRGASIYDAAQEEGGGQEMQQICGQTVKIMRTERWEGSKSQNILWMSYMEAP